MGGEPALKLVEPGTILRRVTLEGLAHVDDPDDEYETVDVAEYLGAAMPLRQTPLSCRS
ncbi:hypothetical protein [Streptomyces anulatus]|uniref:hypothetical protein n=1 Tax=Streptomyces anulatus TaxID=1892 RepID=UPI001D181897|nr:hypothetical protein [Streptomyces anulatus]